tara:strand:+ start:40 stop:288 length:249 start_codon:yes stop_codon:yes gene_type:complete
MAQRRAITPSFASYNTADAVGIALTALAPGLGGIHHLHRFGLQLTLALKSGLKEETYQPAARLLIQQHTNELHIPQLREISV